MKASEIYEGICEAPDTGAAVAELGARELAALLVYLREKQVFSGVPGEVYGFAMVEAADRFSMQHTKR